jgi:tetratricopeptide (TPR) repeat protein
MDSKLKLAIEYRELGKYEKSKEILLDLVSLSTNPEVFYQCAWTHDVLGLESNAIIYYEKAIALGLVGDDLLGCYIGLGSSLRCTGQYQKANDVFAEALLKFEENDVLKTFLAMTKYNLEEYEDAMKLLLSIVVKVEGVKKFEKAIGFYRHHLNDIYK